MNRVTKEVADIMAIESINTDLCNGCGICVDICPGDVFRMDEETNKAVIKYPRDCVFCRFCETDCPQDAIYVSDTRDTTPMPLTLWGIGI